MRVKAFTAEWQRDSARCFFWQFNIKHLEPDWNQMKKRGTQPYNTANTPFICFFYLLFFFFSLCHVQTHTVTSIHAPSKSSWSIKPYTLYALSCSLGSTCLQLAPIAASFIFLRGWHSICFHKPTLFSMNRWTNALPCFLHMHLLQMTASSPLWKHFDNGLAHVSLPPLLKVPTAQGHQAWVVCSCVRK